MDARAWLVGRGAAGRGGMTTTIARRSGSSGATGLVRARRSPHVCRCETPEAPEAVESAAETSADEASNPGFWWDPTYNRWVRDDKRGVKLEDFETKVVPLTGESYTVWPACHTALVSAGLESLPCERVQEMVSKGEAVLVDVRPEYNFRRNGRIAGSANVPLYREVRGKTLIDRVKKVAVGSMMMKATERNPDFVKMAQDLAAKSEGALLVVVCSMGGTLKTEVQRKKKGRPAFQDPERAFGRESRSLKAAYELISAGVKNVAHLEGGISMWSHEGRPME